jgi:hypothetical protein
MGINSPKRWEPPPKASRSEVDGWRRILSGESVVPEKPSPTSYSAQGEFSREYLDAILDIITRIGVELKITQRGYITLAGNRSAVDGPLTKCLQNCKWDLLRRCVERMSEIGSPWTGPPIIPIPNPDWRVEVVTEDGFGRYCLGDALPADWVRWRRANTFRWFARECYSWEER